MRRRLEVDILVGRGGMQRFPSSLTEKLTHRHLVSGADRTTKSKAEERLLKVPAIPFGVTLGIGFDKKVTRRERGKTSQYMYSICSVQTGMSGIKSSRS